MGAPECGSQRSCKVHLQRKSLCPGDTINNNKIITIEAAPPLLLGPAL